MQLPVIGSAVFIETNPAAAKINNSQSSSVQPALKRTGTGIGTGTGTGNGTGTVDGLYTTHRRCWVCVELAPSSVWLTTVQVPQSVAATRRTSRLVF